jgi:cytochrome c
MFMKSLLLLPVLSTLVLSSSLFAADAEKLFDTKCSMCHVKTPPQDMSTLVAPPLMGVMRHVKMSYDTKESAEAFMIDYVLAPSKDKAVCMPQKMARFGLMPSQKGNVTKEELKVITGWMYDNFPPANFQGRGLMRGSVTP